MKLPDIDFKFWYNINTQLNNSREEGVIIKRHHAVATQILNSYKDKKIRLGYFTEFEDEKEIFNEYRRIKNLTYEELENEILKISSEIIKDGFKNKELILKTFDLIQIWGGRPGGNNIYNSNGFDRINNTEWIKIYIDGLEKASVGDYESYQILKSIKHLQIPFASKHLNFFSRHLKVNSLIIIDEKISHCFKMEDPKSLSKEDIKLINDLCRAKANDIGYEPWQIEKALFSFHSSYFEARKLINTNYLNHLDINDVGEINNWYTEIKNNDSKKEIKPNRYRKVNNENKITAKYTLKNNECFTTNDGLFFIKNSAIERCNIPNSLLKRGISMLLKGEKFYNFKGKQNLIVII